MCRSMQSGSPTMPVCTNRRYRRPTATLLHIDGTSLLAGSQEEETVEFTFRTETNSIWDERFNLE